MINNLKKFPNGQGVDAAEFSIQVNDWKEAFETELREKIKNIEYYITQIDKIAFIDRRTQEAQFKGHIQAFKTVLGEDSL